MSCVIWLPLDAEHPLRTSTRKAAIKQALKSLSDSIFRDTRLKQAGVGLTLPTAVFDLGLQQCGWLHFLP
jgi:hypothetical protein